MNRTPDQTLVTRNAAGDNVPSFGKRAFASVLIILACCLTFSCKKIEPVDTSTKGDLKFEPTKFTDAIPDEYGPLISVTQSPQNPEWVGLWFQQPDKTITGVFVHVNQGRIYEKTLTIPRK